MGTLAGAFGPRVIRESMERQLRPGAVIYLEVRFSQVTKSKFLVLVGSDGDDLYFVINSKTNRFIAKQSELNACQVTLDAANHNFLDHDSVIACHEVHRFSRESVIRELLRDTSRLRGEISRDVRDQVLAAVKAATTISQRVQGQIIAAFM
jgi:hypothetical protein